MKSLLLAFTTASLALSASSLAQGTSAAKPDDSSVVAQVGGADIKLSELKEALSKLDLKDQALLSQNPETLNKVARVLLVQRLMLREAKAKSYHEKPEVKAQLERAQDVALAESYLASMSEPAADFPSETELAAAYDTVRPNLGTPKQWRLAQIYVAAPPDISKADLEKAQVKLDTVKKTLEAKNPDFADLAQKYSDDEVTLSKGGEIGWLPESGIVSDIRSEATLLKAGEISKPIRLKDGWHILKCVDIKEAFTPKLEDVKIPLRQRMRDERTAANSQVFVAKLLKDHPLAINEIVLKEAMKKADK